MLPGYQIRRVKYTDLKINQFAKIIHDIEPDKNRYEFGPKLFKLQSPYERIEKIAMCPILDQDDYITVSDAKGVKRNVRGPVIFNPTIGDSWTDSLNSTQVPVNNYIVIQDSDNSDRPIEHIRGPYNFFPTPFQTIIKNRSLSHWPCVEITKARGIHLQKNDGSIILIGEPQYYMPDVGEKVLAFVDRTVLLNTDFCIVKKPNGEILVRDGTIESDRSFFIEPFFEFHFFNYDDIKKCIISTLPSFLSHRFTVRTSDNVVLELDIRISFQINDVSTFASNPIDFYPWLKNHIQNELLDSFAKSTLRQFMATFSSIALKSVDTCDAYFAKFGINVLDVQILNFICPEGIYIYIFLYIYIYIYIYYNNISKIFILL
jgi:hypothetical protein